MADRNGSNASRSTVVVVPREDFSTSVHALELLLAETPERPVVYIDGGSPRRVQRQIEALARRHGFTLVRTDHYLTPNEARNLARPHVHTDLVVYIDNDVVVTPGWLEALEQCADETDAAIVAPVIGIGDPADPVVHQGGLELCRLEGEPGKRQLVQDRPLVGEPVAAAMPALERVETEVAEFHCVLIRRDVLDGLGPLDEELRTSREHIDVSLAVRKAGGTIWSEPASVVTYARQDPLRRADLAYYVVRWDEAASRATLAHFARKWQLDDDEHVLEHQLSQIRMRRRAGYRPYRKPRSSRIRRIDGYPIAVADRLVQPWLRRRDARRRAQSPTPRVVHESDAT